MKKLVLLVVLLLASVALQASELVFHWNKICENKIFDMELMPDNDYFVVVLSNEFQVRRTEDGEIVNTYKKNESFSFHDIEFTPDSLKLIVAYDSIIEMRSAKDFSIINTYTLPADAEDYTQYIMEIKVDPIRPYIYTIIDKVKYDGGKVLTKRNIFKINSDNLNESVDITPLGLEEDFIEHIAISNDGKYLATINQGVSFIKTIDLTKEKEVQSFKISDCYVEGGGHCGYPVCIKFSEINSDKIYFSGTFPQSVAETDQHSGLFIYSISENKIIDSTFGVGAERVSEGYFSLIKNEERLLFTNKFVLYVINLKDLLKEISSETYYISQQILYSKSKDIILGRGEQHITKLTYKNGSGVKPEPEIYKTIYPNPTTGTINIELNCKKKDNYYELYNSNSLLINTKIIDINISILQIDLSSYSNGIYFITLHCGTDVKTFKIIKEY